MFADAEFISTHFPPPLLFETVDDLRRHKSRLIVEAQLMQDTVRHELAVLLYQQAGELELRLADAVDEARDRPTRNHHLVSAASCFMRSGDLSRARETLERASVPDEAAAFFARLPALEKTAAKHALALHHALVQKSIEALRAAAQQAWGLLPVRMICWPLLRLGTSLARHEETKEAFRRLIIAYPQDLRFHLLYLSSSAVSDAAEAIRHATSLTKAFPTELAAHVALGTALVRGRYYEDAVAVCETALDIVRHSPDAAKDPNSMVSMTFANSSVALRRSGKRREGLAVLDEAVQRLPADILLRTLYALTLLADGDEQRAFEQAAVAAEQADSENGHDRVRTHWPYTVAGVLALRRAEWAEAIRLLDTAYKMSHGRARARNLNDLGVALVSAGDAMNAKIAFEAAIEQDSYLEIAQSNLARLERGETHADMATSHQDMEDDLVRVFQSNVQNDQSAQFQQAA